MGRFESFIRKSEHFFEDVGSGSTFFSFQLSVQDLVFKSADF